MELKLKYNNAVSLPCGVFVEDPDLMKWVSVASELNDPAIRFYPVPGNLPNTVSGALLITKDIEGIESLNHTRIHSVGKGFYLMQNSALSPQFSEVAIAERFKGSPHFFHPVYGLMQLKELTNWSSFVALKPLQVKLTTPDEGPKVPQRLGEYFIREIEPEEVLKSLMEKSVPNRASLDSPPLTSWEKVKLKALRTLLGKKDSKESKDGKDAKREGGLNSEESNNQGVSGVDKKSWWKRNRNKMEQELDNLEERNKKELDKLMDMLEKNPDEALKYALPIDRSGSSRGPEVGFTMTNRWKSGMGSSGGSGGSVNIGDDRTTTLRDKYTKIAVQYVKNEEWEKASYVYLELLSEPSIAGNVLEKGKRYEAAAAIFLSKCNNKVRAAECYENGHFYRKSIDLYEELGQQMKVGDLYTKMGNSSKAKTAYKKEVTKMVDSKRFYEAGDISQNKISDIHSARVYFVEGWKVNQRPNVCLNAYLDSYTVEERKKNIQKLHSEHFEGGTAHRFIDVLKDQLKKEKDLHNDVELIVYETVARNAPRDKTIVDKLKNFNKGELVTKDIMRFKQVRRKK